MSTASFSPLTLDVALINQEAGSDEVGTVPPTSGPSRSLSKNKAALRLDTDSMKSPGESMHQAYDSNDSLTIGSFTAVSHSPAPEHEHLEKIINFLHKVTIMTSANDSRVGFQKNGMATIQEDFENLSSSSSHSTISRAKRVEEILRSSSTDEDSLQNVQSTESSYRFDHTKPVHEQAVSSSFMSQLNELIAQTLRVYKDPVFLRILKSFGWNSHSSKFSNASSAMVSALPPCIQGKTRISRIPSFQEEMFDKAGFLQAVTNIYLKLKYRNASIQANPLASNESDNFYDNMSNPLFAISNKHEINERIEKMSAFAPDFVIECVCRNPDNFFGVFGQPLDYSFVGACMLVDISGFSKFSASMCSKGVEGLDELRKVTSGLLGQFVKAVYEHEGDVVAFAGDALICVFYDDKSCFNPQGLERFPDVGDAKPSFGRNSPIPLAPTKTFFESKKKVDACFRALHCANLLRSVQLTGLSTHIGIGYGEMSVAFLGGYNGQWVYLLNGKCLCELASCVEEAASQTVVCTKSCYERLQYLDGATDSPFIVSEHQEHLAALGIASSESTDEESLALDRSVIMKILRMNTQGCIEYPSMQFSKIGSNGNFKLDYLPESLDINRLLNAAGRTGFVEAVLLASTPVKHNESGSPLSSKSPTNAFSGGAQKKSLKNIGLNRISMGDLREAMETEEQERRMKVIDSLTMFVPVPVVSVLQNENSNQLGELRTVTTLFLNLDSYSCIDHAKPSSLQPFFAIAQMEILETGGYLRQFLVDDKGCVLIAMWGMPSHTYANNCSRALFTAVSIQRKVATAGFSCSVGITTGTVFCGTIGAVERCDYVGIGSEVNLAARLMSKAKGGNIFLDETTYYNLSQNNKAFFTIGKELELKGMPYPIRPFVFVQDSSDPSTEYNNKIPRKVITLEDLDSGSYMHSSHKLIKKKVMNILEKQLDKISSSSSALSTASTLSYTLATSGGSAKLLSVARTPRAKGKRFHHDFRPNNVNVTILCGQPGAGKSTSVEYFRLSARQRGIEMVHIKAQTLHRNSPYGIIKEIFLQLIGEDNFRTPDQQNGMLVRLVNQAYRDTNQDQYSAEDKAFAKHSLEILLGLNCVHKPRKIASSYHQNHHEHHVNQGKRHHPSTPRSMNHPIPPENLDNDEWDTFELESYQEARHRDDYSFYKILAVLLRSEPLALIIENAHYCDELTWNELLLMLLGYDFDICMLLTMRSYHSVTASQNRNRRSGSFSSHSNPFLTHANSASNGHIDGNPPPIMGDVPNNNHFPFRLRTTSSIQCMLPIRATSESATGIAEGDEQNTTITVIDLFEKHGLAYMDFASFRAIGTHPNCIVYELKSLNEDEVKARVLHQLNVDSISDELIRLVSDVSSGNPYWVDMIAQFIQDHGFSQFENTLDPNLIHRYSPGEVKTTKSEELPLSEMSVQKQPFWSPKSPTHKERLYHRISPQQSLKALILCRFELLPLDMQKILKYASVSGTEFTASMIEFLIPSPSSTVAPSSTRTAPFTVTGTLTTGESIDGSALLTPLSLTSPSTMDSLEYLEKHGFISWISDHPTIVYAFRNDLIQRTIYELLPPSDASKIHILVAQYIEQEFALVLRSFYPSLAHHYRQGHNKAKAFKYELKAAALVVSSGAYHDGFLLAERSLHLAEHCVELIALLEVIDKAVEDLQQIVMPQIRQEVILSHFLNRTAENDDGSLQGVDSFSTVEEPTNSLVGLNDSVLMMRKFSHSVYSLVTAKNNPGIISAGTSNHAILPIDDVSERSSETFEEKVRLSVSFISHSNDSNTQTLLAFQKMKCQVQLAQRLIESANYPVASAVSSSLSANLQWNERELSTVIDLWLESLGISTSTNGPHLNGLPTIPQRETQSLVGCLPIEAPIDATLPSATSITGEILSPMSPLTAAAAEARAELLKASTVNRLSWKPSFEELVAENSTVVQVSDELAHDVGVLNMVVRSSSSCCSSSESSEDDQDKIYIEILGPNPEVDSNVAVVSVQPPVQCQCACTIS